MSTSTGHVEVAVHLRQVAWTEQLKRERRRTAMLVCAGIGAIFGLLWSVGLVLTMHAHGVHIR